MKKFATIALTSMLILGVAASASAAVDVYVSNVESYSPGAQNGGNPIAPGRDNPAEALGAPDDQFVSLGFGGELIVSFDQLLGGTISVTVSETTNGSYQNETAQVSVSKDGISWNDLGTATNDGGNQEDSFFQLNPEMCVKYVRITDTTNSQLHNNNADGFDVDAVGAEYTGECEEQQKELDLKIKNKNFGYVKNVVESEANTGGNTANGGNGGDAGNGGAVKNSDDDNTGGNGGNAGNGGNGGTIVTGDAFSVVTVANTVNTNITRTNACGCAGDLTLRVRNMNGAKVKNYIGSGADSGDNDANGGSASGNAGNGGNVENSEDGNTGGNGGNTGRGGHGGGILTGYASSIVTVFNDVNRNRTRVR